MSEIKNAEDLKKILGSRIRELTLPDTNISSLGIKEDTLGKYYKGQRFPTTENIVAIKNHYKVPFAYLFGDTDNKDPNFADISYKLGLSANSTNKLISMNKSENAEERELQFFALNQLIENIDFLELGKLLLIPNESNRFIKSTDIYDYYSFFINHGQGVDDYKYDMREINKKKEYNNFILNKRLFELFEKTRNSKECAKIFMSYVDNERKMIEEAEETIKEFIIPDDYEPFEIDEETEKIIRESNKQDEIRNQQIVDKRKKDLGI